MRGTVTRQAHTGPSDRPAGFAGAAACLAHRRPRRGPGAWRGGPSAGQDRRPLPGQALGREAPRQREGCPHVPRAGRLRGTSRPSPLPRGLLCPQVRPAAAAGRGAWPSPDAAPGGCLRGRPAAARHRGRRFLSPRDDRRHAPSPWQEERRPGGRGRQRGPGGTAPGGGAGTWGPGQGAASCPSNGGVREPVLPGPVPRGRGVSGGQSRLPAARGGGDAQRGRGWGCGPALLPGAGCSRIWCLGLWSLVSRCGPKAARTGPVEPGWHLV